MGERSKPGPSTIQGEPVQEKERRFSVARAQQITRPRKMLAVPKFQAVTGFDMVAGFVQAGG